VVALNVYRASNMWVDLCNNSRRLVLELQSTEVSRTVTSCLVRTLITFYAQ